MGRRTGTSIGGAIIDGGNFNWGNGKFRNLPSRQKAIMVYASGIDFSARTDRLAISRLLFVPDVEGLRDHGPALSRSNAFLLLQRCGKTLSRRASCS